MSADCKEYQRLQGRWMVKLLDACLCQLLSVSHNNRRRLSIFMSVAITQLSDGSSKIFWIALILFTYQHFQGPNANRCLRVRHFICDVCLDSTVLRQKAVCHFMYVSLVSIKAHEHSWPLLLLFDLHRDISNTGNLILNIVQIAF